MKHYLFAALAASWSYGCAPKLVMVAPLVSMTKDGPPAGDVKRGRPIRSEYCPGDTPKAKTGSYVGLMDEAILEAQQSNHADYIRDARFTIEGFWKKCMVISGEAIVAAENQNSGRDEPAHPPGKKKKSRKR